MHNFVLTQQYVELVGGQFNFFCAVMKSALSYTQIESS